MANPLLTFSDFDLLGLKEFCQRFEKYLSIEHHFVEGSLVVSLNAPFGSGKSTFIDMWCNDLTARRDKDSKLFLPVRINAWESDHCGDPMLSIISALTKAVIDQGDSAKSSLAENVRELASAVGPYAVGVANEALAAITDFNAIEALENSKKVKTMFDSPSASFLDVFEARMTALQNLKFSLSECFGAVTPTAIVFIDELDRCRPNYAVEYLETVKHLFDIRGLIFVLAVDDRQLQSSVEVMFGRNVEFPEYYRKFVHRSVNLPTQENRNRSVIIKKYTEKFLSMQTGNVWIRNTCADYNDHHTGPIAIVLTCLPMTMRQAQAGFRVLGHVASTDEVGTLLYSANAAVILLSFMSVTTPAFYHRLGKGEVSDTDFVTFVQNTFSKCKQNVFCWWAEILTVGYYFSPYEKVDKTSEILMKFGYQAETAERSIRHTVDNWGDSSERGIKQVYRRIESFRSFDDEMS